MHLAYGILDQARRLTNTSLDDATLGSLRDSAEDEIRLELERNGLDLGTGAMPGDLLTCSLSWTCRNILRRHKLDGTCPNSYGPDGQAGIDRSIMYYDHKGRHALDNYLSTSAYDEFDEGCPGRIAEDDQ